MPDITHDRCPVERTEERQPPTSGPPREPVDPISTRTDPAMNNRRATDPGAAGTTCPAEHSDAHHDPRLAKLTGQVQAACDRARELQQRAKEVRADTEATRQLVADARRRRPNLLHRRDLMRNSEFLRLAARLETMPVIEQAKGIIMAQSRCGDDAAFDMLRRASQRSNIPVRELAKQIVSEAVGSPKEPVASPNGHARPRPQSGVDRAVSQLDGKRPVPRRSGLATNPTL